MKTCTICKQSLSLAEFNRKARSKDGLQPHCRECNRQRSRAYYARNREEHKREVNTRRRAYTLDKQRKIVEYLSSHPCVDCGESDPIVLEFDHVRDKECNVSEKIRSWSWPRLLGEIHKCEVRCANCHRRKTHLELGTYRATM